MRAKSTKLLEENTGVNLGDLGLHDGALGKTPEARATKVKNKFTFIRIKKFCASKDTIMIVKDSPQSWRKYLLTIYLIRELISRIYKGL